jgi:hypothetical protein
MNAYVSGNQNLILMSIPLLASLMMALLGWPKEGRGWLMEGACGL